MHPESPAQASARLESILERFEAAWHQPHPLSIEDLLPPDEPLRFRVLLELIHADLEFRLKSGAAARVEDYIGRFPNLSGDSAVLLDLLRAELRFRRRHEPTLTLEEYRRRFPALADRLDTTCEEPDAGSAQATTPPVISPITPPAITPRDGQLTTDFPPPAGPGSPIETRVEANLRPFLPAEFDPQATQPPQPATKNPNLPQIPGYDLLSELGRGGMGVVYKARQHGLNRLVAIKMILAGAYAGLSELARFRLEAEAIARLHHPNIVQVYEIGEFDGRPFFSLEFVHGGSLDRKLAKTPQPPDKAAEAVETLARAIHHAHEHQVIHRDLKPANVLVTADGTPKITDFGLAKALDADDHTRTGAVMGTPNYMAPEQAEGRIKDIAAGTDVYALGAILYEMLTGSPPFRAASVADLLTLVRTVDPVPVIRVQPSVPRDLDTICLKCLAKAPDRRYHTAAELADDLRRFLEHRPILARPVGAWERVRKWATRNPREARLYAGLGLSLITLLVVGVGLWQWKEQAAREYERAEQQRERDEQANRDRKRSVAMQTLTDAQQAVREKTWERAHDLFTGLMTTLNQEPWLHDLRQVTEAGLAEADAALGRVKNLAAAGTRFTEFQRRRNQAIFRELAFTGGGKSDALKATRDDAWQALGVAGVRPGDTAAPPPDPFCTADQQAEIITGSYELLLIAAEATARPVPGSAETPVDQARSALGVLRQAAGLDPENRLGLSRKILLERQSRYLAQVGDTAGAEKARAAAAGLKPVAPVEFFLAAMEAYERHQPEAAIDLCREVLARQLSHFWARYLQAVCYTAKKQWTAAEVNLTACLGLHPEFAWPYLNRAYVYAEQGRYNLAEKDLGEALKLDPDELTRYGILVTRGFVRNEQRQYAAAATDLEQAIAMNTRNYQAFLNLAESYKGLKKPAEAVAQLDRAIEKYPAFGPLYRRRAQLRAADDEAGVLADLAVALRLGPWTDAEAAGLHRERGRILRRQHNTDEALAAADAALALAPDDPDAHQLRAELLIGLRRYPDALASLDPWLKAHPTALGYRLRGLIRDRTGDHPGAIADYSRSLELAPAVETWVHRGMAHVAEEAPKPALADFEHALKLDPENVEGLIGRAMVRAQLGQHELAATDVERARRLAKPPVSSRLLYLCARVYALAARAVEPEAKQQDRRAVEALSRYQDRGLKLLREAVQAEPTNRAAFWQDLTKDPGLRPLRRSGGYQRLAEEFGPGKKAGR